jgi:DNA invertase Pin-like site-specific DNA recombinase
MEVGVERAQTPRGEQHRDRQHRSGDEQGDVDLGDGEQQSGNGGSERRPELQNSLEDAEHLGQRAAR